MVVCSKWRDCVNNNRECCYHVKPHVLEDHNCGPCDGGAHPEGCGECVPVKDTHEDLLLGATNE
jgi:hypothetical protein